MPFSLSSPDRLRAPKAGGIKSSLRKLPSSLFAHDRRATGSSPTSTCTHTNMNATTYTKTMTSPPTTTKYTTNTLATLDEGTVAGRQDKKKPKARRALADILHWGSSANTAAASPAAPPPPPKDAPRRSAGSSGRAAPTGLSTLRALPPPTFDIVRRPSCGDDPFSRPAPGATVVDHVFRPAVKPASVKGIEAERRSQHSVKALSSKSANDDASSKASSAHHMTTSPSPPTTRRVSVPIHNVPAAELPPRSASLGRTLDRQIKRKPSSQPVLPPAAFVPPAKPLEPADKTLKREKTRSRVWGIFSGAKSKRVKPKAAEEVTAQPLPSTSIRVDSVDMHQVVEGIYAPVPASRSPPTHRIARPRPPVLHITKASVDTTNNTDSKPASATIKAHAVPQVDPDSPFIVPSTPSTVTGGRMWESVVGTAGERPSEDGPREIMAALVCPTRLPKRKSLSGIFGVAVKRSIEKLRSSPPRKSKAKGDSGERRRPPPLALRSLAEEIEDAEQPKTGPSPAPYVSRFASADLMTDGGKPAMPKQTDFATVTSATSQLFDLLTTCNFSATSSPASVDQRRSLAIMTSLQSLRGAAEAVDSPTPIRKAQSAQLLGKGGKRRTSSTKNASPLKYALHRAAHGAAASPVRQPTNGASPVSMVKKGMRNIFAPPSPLEGKRRDISPPRDFRRLGTGLGSPIRIELQAELAMLPPSPLSARHELDIPSDLRAELTQITKQPSPGTAARLGLPYADVQNRPSPTGRRNRMAHGPEDIALVAHTAVGRVSPVAPHISLDLGRPLSPEDASFSRLLAPPPAPVDKDDARKSFDFTGEFAMLDQGDQRASFVEALVAMRKPSETLLRLAAALSDEQLRSPTETSFSHSMTQASNERTQNHTRSAPFKGDFAFQQTFSQQTRAPPMAFHFPPPTMALPPPPMALPLPPAVALPPVPPAPAPTHRRAHHRTESGMSFASMSSLGAPIDSGIAGEYTNYFDKEFASALPDNTVNRRSSQDSIASDGSAQAHTRRTHHRRSSSICSVDSIVSAEIAFVTSGPPISMHNATRRSSYVSRHRRDGSADSMLSAVRGRPDWAAHRRNASSTDSAASFARLGRPGLGERMFQLDGGVQLTSITGSPPDEATATSAAADALESPLLQYQVSADGSFYQHDNRHLSWVSSTAESAVPSTDDEGSLFGAHDPRAPPSSFFLRGARPVSTTSSVSSSENADDTFINVAKYAQRTVAKEQTCIPGVSHDMLSTPASAFQRPQRPRSAAHRRRPVDLVLTPDLDTPGLTSPSASETSSRMSLDTRFSDSLSAIVVSRAQSRARPIGGGHARGKSSITAAVNVDATIHEEASTTSVRHTAAPTDDSAAHDSLMTKASNLWESSRPERLATANTWRDWQREADDEYRRTREVWVDSRTSKQAVADFQMPTTPDEIAAFLALSSQAYQPLPQHPASRTAVHRRKSSLADTRTMASPYAPPPAAIKTKPARKSDPPRGNPFESFFDLAPATGLHAPALPLPRECPHPFQTKRGSLITKFERTLSAASTASASSDQDNAAPTPATTSVFAQFVSGYAPATPPKSAPITTGMRSLLLLSTPEKDATDADQDGAAAQSPLDRPLEERVARMHVASAVRRKNLGWGRRRNSDGPSKIIGNETAATPGAGRGKTGGCAAMTGSLDLGEAPIYALRHRESPGDVPMSVYGDDWLRPSPVPFKLHGVGAAVAPLPPAPIEAPPTPTKPVSSMAKPALPPPSARPPPLARVQANAAAARAPASRQHKPTAAAKTFAPFADAVGDVSPPRVRAKPPKPARSFAVYSDAPAGRVFNRPAPLQDKENNLARPAVKPLANARHASSRKSSSRSNVPTRSALRV